MMYLGLSRIDASMLKRSNFNSDFSILTFTRKKTKRPHSMPVPGFLRDQLRFYYFRYWDRMIDDYLFFSNWRNQSENKHLTVNSISAKFKAMRRTLGMEDVYYTYQKSGLRIKLYRLSSHTMRHFAGWRFYEAGGKCIKTAQELLGHKRVETTAGYINALESANNKEEIMNNAFSI